jgi:hypothetical protein
MGYKEPARKRDTQIELINLINIFLLIISTEVTPKMQIADQCKPGMYNAQGYTPTQAWKEDDYVQWGSGIRIDRKNKVMVPVKAFFEAFPQGDNHTFLRGEGETLEEAEKKAFAQYETILKCAKHEWEARGRTDGYGYCKHCEMSQSDVLPITTFCCECNIPTAWKHVKGEGGYKWYCRLHDHNYEVLSQEEETWAWERIKLDKITPSYKEEGKDGYLGFVILHYFIPFKAPDSKFILDEMRSYEYWLDTAGKGVFKKRNKDALTLFDAMLGIEETEPDKIPAPPGVQQ